jgi:hypothetical protein
MNADLIKHPQTPMANRLTRLKRQGVSVEAHEITVLLQFHGLSEKKVVQQDF